MKIDNEQIQIIVESTFAGNRKRTSVKAVFRNVVITSLLASQLLSGNLMPVYADTTLPITDNVVMEYQINGLTDYLKEVETTIVLLQRLIVKNQDLASTIGKLAVSLKQIETELNNTSDLDAVGKIIENVETLIKNINVPKDAIIQNLNALKTKYESLGGSVTATITTPQYKANPVNIKFLDVKSTDWFYSFVNDLVGRGGIKGYPDGTFKPQGTITNAEYISMLVNSLGDKSTLNSIPTGVQWYSKNEEYLNIKKVDLSGVDYTKPITRESVAYITANLLMRDSYIKSSKETIENQDIEGAKGWFSDFNQVNSKNQQALAYMYREGIIKGSVSNGKYVFKPQSNLTRAEAATIIVNALNVIEDKVIETKRAPITIREDDKNRTILPQAGDTFVPIKGSPVVLTARDFSGTTIVGFDQGVNIYTGMRYADGSYLKDGDNGTKYWSGTSDDYKVIAGQVYMVDKKTGMGYFASQWHAIKGSLMTEAATTIKNPYERQEYGPGGWVVYDGKMWTWQGPSTGSY